MAAHRIRRRPTITKRYGRTIFLFCKQILLPTHHHDSFGNRFGWDWLERILGVCRVHHQLARCSEAEVEVADRDKRGGGGNVDGGLMRMKPERETYEFEVNNMCTTNNVLLAGWFSSGGRN